MIAKEYPGWGLGEIKGLTKRERTYWQDLLKWKREQRASPG